MEERVKASSGIDVVYTMGMRGVHDGQMEGRKNRKTGCTSTGADFSIPARSVKKYQQKDITTIPQVFTPYKEVLEFYDNGLKVPDDITLVWPDDNYGYIQRLSDEQEQKRKGGAGVYYHVSYWGRPHDYQWLCTTHPSLIREEMMKAYQTGADKLWVLNVGDIKPAEYDIQLLWIWPITLHRLKTALIPSSICKTGATVYLVVTGKQSATHCGNTMIWRLKESRVYGMEPNGTEHAR